MMLSSTSYIHHALTWKMLEAVWESCLSSGAHSPEGTRWRKWIITTWIHTCCGHLQSVVLHIFLLLLCYCYRSVILCRMTGGTSPRFISNIHTLKIIYHTITKTQFKAGLSFLKKGSSFLYQPIGTLTGPNQELQGWQTHLMFWLLPWSCYY